MFHILCVSTVIYLMLLFGLSDYLGLVGAAMAYVVFYLFWSFMTLSILTDGLSRDDIQDFV